MKASEVKAVVDQVTILEPINRFLHMNLEDQREIIDAIFEKTRMPIAALSVAELHGFIISHEIKARNAEAGSASTETGGSNGPGPES